MPVTIRSTKACVLLLAGAVAALAEYSAPAGVRPPVRRPGAESVLPGGRTITPLGRSYPTGPAPWGLAVSPNGNQVAAASLTLLRRDKMYWWVRQANAEGALASLVFEGEHTLLTSEGGTGRVRALDLATGDTKRTYDLNTGYAGELALDRTRGLLFVLDEANARLVAIDVRRHQVAGSLALGARPRSIALAPGGRRAYITMPEAQSLAIADLENPAAPALQARVRLAGMPSGVTAGADGAFVSDSSNDSVIVVGNDGRVRATIPIRIPGLEQLRGVEPDGLAYVAESNWLLVAETGINAVAVIDAASGKVVGHLPAAWRPTRVVEDRGWVYVLNEKGNGGGPNHDRTQLEEEARQGIFRHGTVGIFPLPAASDLERLTGQVMANNGFTPSARPATALPAAIRHVVVIVKGNRTFDEVLGDVATASNGAVAADEELARFGRHANVGSERRGLRQRLPVLMAVNITPNHHELASRWAFSDNFYGIPEAIDEAAIRRHLEQNRVGAFWLSGDGANGVLAELERRYAQGGEALPRFLFIRLPQDQGAPRPDDGYPYPASYMAGNDYALGRIVEYLSKSRWWREMAVFVTESGAQEGADHVDSHRTLLFAVGPWAKKNYVSHVDTGFPGLLKTAFRLLGIGPLRLDDAAASDLTECFATEPDDGPYQAIPIDPRLFDPSKRESQ